MLGGSAFLRLLELSLSLPRANVFRVSKDDRWFATSCAVYRHLWCPFKLYVSVRCTHPGGGGADLLYVVLWAIIRLLGLVY